MAFRMGVEINSGGKVIPAGIYEVKLVGFKPKDNKNKDGVNFNAQMIVINHPEYDGTKLYETLSTKAGFVQKEFSHAFGLEVEDMGNGLYCIPGVWDKDEVAFVVDDKSTWQYDGPLVGRTAQVEVGIDIYEGKENNKIRKYICALSGCTHRHMEDLLARK